MQCSGFFLYGIRPGGPATEPTRLKALAAFELRDRRGGKAGTSRGDAQSSLIACHHEQAVGLN